MGSPRHLRWAIRSFAGVLLAALLVAFALELAVDGGDDPAAKVVMSYVKSRRAGDASKACDQLSGGERRELVARVSRTPLSNASGRDCEKYVLLPSRWSDLTRPALATFRIADGEARRFAADVRLVRPSGFDQPIVEVWKRDGQWKIDTQAAEGSTFVRFCRRDGAAADRCECLFDQARARDPRLLDRRSGVMDLFRAFESGRREELLRDVFRRCADKLALRPSA